MRSFCRHDLSLPRALTVDGRCRLCRNESTRHRRKHGLREFRGYSQEQAVIVFWSQIKIGEPNECWEWTGTRNPKGYGQLNWHGRKISAHRLAFFLSGGILPEDTEVCHTCDNHWCCNPSHLFAGTHAVNMADAKTRGRMQRGEKQHSHKLTEAQVLAIRSEKKSGASYAALSGKYGVSSQSIYELIKGKTWGWLKGN